MKVWLFHQTTQGEITDNFDMIRLWNNSNKNRSRIASALHRGEKIEEIIIINRPVQEVFSFCHTLENLPKFIPGLKMTIPLSRMQSQWIWTASNGETLESTVELIAEIEGRMISWQTLPESPFCHAGSVWFRDASHDGLTGPRDLSTELHIHLRYKIGLEEPNNRTLNGKEKTFAGLEMSPNDIVVKSLTRLKLILENEGAIRAASPLSSKLHLH